MITAFHDVEALMLHHPPISPSQIHTLPFKLHTITLYFTEAFLVGMITAFHDVEAVMLAFIVTFAAVAALTIFAINTKACALLFCGVPLTLVLHPGFTVADQGGS